ncbi:MAG: hypothetical protein GF411_08230 [Candidatus Lokiarchaeota archaeon]|nr:hypothetical protein [Candidatus Lokiarchaeota archaeon]
MSYLDEIRTWFWVPVYWVPIYFLSIVLSSVSTLLIQLRWVIPIILVLMTAPIIYKNLVGGGCSLKFQICALVKGMIAGLLFAGLTLFADVIVFSALSISTISSVFGFDTAYLTWLFAGLIGGFGARIVEVRGLTTPSSIRPIIENE